MDNPDKLLLEAARAGDVGGIRAALAAGATQLGRALAKAASGGHELAGGYLIDRGASLRPLGPPLFAAVSGGHAGFVRLLFERGAKLIDDDLLQDCLEAAARQGSAELLALLLEHGWEWEPDLDEPLRLAVKRDALDAARLLLDRGADPHVDEYADGYNSPFFLAIEAGSPKAVSLMLEYGADPRAMSGELLRQAEKRGDPAILALLREALGG